MVMQRTARSAIGMGCASLGSRVGRREGLKALARAYDAGITWFDVAPSYGDAEAETILGEFVQGRRDKIRICTKVGIRPPRTTCDACSKADRACYRRRRSNGPKIRNQGAPDGEEFGNNSGDDFEQYRREPAATADGSHRRSCPT